MSTASTYLVRALVPLFFLALPLTSFADAPAAISAVSGGGQWTTEGGAYTNHLVAAVTDSNGNPVSGVTVYFSGPGMVSTSVPTDAYGEVSVPVTANSIPGGNTVTAYISGSPQIMTTFGLMVGAAGACAQSNTVTSTDDSNAVGTLREAVFDLCPGGTVDLSQLPNDSIIMLSSRIYLSQNITLQGPTDGNTVTISGNNATRIFFLESGNVTITNLMLANGLAQGGNSYYGGGAAGMGGGIFQNGGSLTMTNVVMSGNHASGGSGNNLNAGSFGGGGFSGNSSSNDNSGAGGGDLGGAGGAGAVSGLGGTGGDGAGGGYAGGMGGFGGGGAARFTNPSGVGGAGGFGGGGGEGYPGAEGGYGAGYAGYNGNNGFYAGGGAGFGGAIFTRAGSLTLTSVAFNNNTATGGGSGGGLANGQGKGGALFIYANVPAHLVDVTFTGSVAADAGEPGIGNSPAPYTNGSSCANGFDTVDICGNAATVTSPDAVQTAYTGSAFNTLQINVNFDGAAPPDGTAVTFTAPTSGASGTFNNAFSTLSSGIATAGFTANGIAGTYTVTATVPGYGTQTFTLTNECGSVPVTNANDSGPGSLRAAVLAACPGSTINLTSLAGQTIPLQSRLYIGRDLTIQGPANGTVTIDGGSATRLFFVQSGNVTMTNLTLAHGLGQGGSSGLGGGAAGMGAAIFQNGGSLTLTNVSFIGNQAVGGSTNGNSILRGGGGFGGPSVGNTGASGGDLGGTGGAFPGGNGGPGGGGGYSEVAPGGAGGFSGGGGQGGTGGGAGGFGGGGGVNAGDGDYPTIGGAGGFGGGMSNYVGAQSAPSGGGGAGFGGAIFEFNGTLTLNSVIFNGSASTGGAGNQNGQAKGGALFVYYGATANLNNVSFSGDQAADAASSAIGNSPAPYTSGSVCPGFDTTDICGLVNFGFGSLNIGQTVTQTIPFNILQTGQLNLPAVLTAGSPNLDYKLVSTTCPTTVASLPLQCTVTVSFTPQYAGERPGAVYLANSTGSISSTALLNGIGVGPQIAFGPGVQSTLSTALSGPVGVAVDGAGDVFVADEKSGTVYELPAGGGSAIAAIPASSPAGVALDAAGNIFYSSSSTLSVYELKQPYNSVPIAIGSGFSNPTGIAVDAAGNVFVADSGLHEVVKIPASGAPQTNVAPFAIPTAVAVDPAGNLYVADFSTAMVYKVPANGGPQTQVGGLFSSPPSGVAVDAAGNVYVALADAQVYKVPVDGSPQFLIGSGFSTPTGVAVDDAGDVFVSDSGTHAAYELNLSQPPTLTFPTTNVTATSPAQSVTIENIGNASLVESALTIGTNFNQVAGSGTPADCTATTTLLQGASCNLSISFAPTIGGPLTGSAQLTNNALNQSPATQSISLNGTGNQPTIAVQVGTSIAGASFSVDSTTYTSTQSFNWIPASSHTIAVTSPQTSSGTRYTFTSWSDSGAVSHQVNASAATTSYTATFSTSYLLTTSISPGGSGTITPSTASPTSDGYYPAGTQLTLTAAPTSAAYLFSNWTGTTASAGNPLAIAMSAPISETANFATNPGSAGSPLAYEPFGEAPGTPLNGVSGSGDSGWAAPWLEQSGSSVEPGYETASANPLTYPGLASTASYAIGGYSYQSVGRQLDVSAAGPFSSYLANGLIGAPGQTIWVSCLLREDANPANGEVNAIFLTPEGGTSAWSTQNGIGIGSFGGNWGLQYNNGTPVLSNVPVTPAQTVLLVAGITFGATNQINLYVNPTLLGGAAPATPSAQLTTTASAAFQSVAYLGGYQSQDTSLSDIQIGPSYASVTHTLLTSQAITFTAPASPVTYPVAPIALSATASSGLPVTFSVLSGPALVNGNTLTITGVGTVMVAANQVGNYLYAPAPQVTESIVVSVTGAPPADALLAYEPFNENSGTPLNGASGGGDSGWAAAWLEQDGSTVEPGYQIASNNPLSYPGLQPTTNYAIGGYAYQSAGRQLNVAAAGPFSSYLANGLIGASGQTVWLSFLLREDANPNNGQTNALFLTPDGGVGAWSTQPGIGIGYFGTGAYWGLQLNNAAPVLSGVPVTQGQAVLMVASITFGATNQINLYVNPALGGSAPATPSAQLTTAASAAFQSLSYLGGYGVNESSLGAIRIGSTFAAVTPSTQTTQSTQTITFTAPASPVTYPVAPITLSATASSALPVTLSVMSGPGSVTGSTLTVTGVGTIVIAANQAGNASYAPAPQVTQSIVVNPSGSPSSGTVLAYEPFGEAPGTPLNGAAGSGDSGWNGPWVEQNGSNVEPGYQVAAANPLSYPGLQTTANYAIGGYAFQSAGRQLNVAANGPFLSYLSNSLIGAPGQTVWLSFLLRGDANPGNGQINAIFLTPDGGTGAWLTGGGIGIGYFGTSPYWGLQLNNGTPVLSTVPVTQGQTVLMVASITFGATNQINLYVNPTSLGGAAPSTPSAQLTTTSKVAFQSLAYLGGYSANESSLADITFGSSYDAVTPVH